MPVRIECRLETVQTLEEAGLLLGTAIERVRAQEALRDREMTGRALLDAPTDWPC